MLSVYPKSLISYLSLFISFLLPFAVHSLNFSFIIFDTNDKNIIHQGAAITYKSYILLTPAANDVGRAIYSEPVRLRDSNTKQIASFKTEFSISIATSNPPNFYGYGMAFFLAPNGSNIPANSGGSFLGLFNPGSSQSVVAVEFDNFFDPLIDDLTVAHVGIDIGSIRSVQTAPLKFQNIRALVNYDGVEKVLTVSLDGSQVLSYSYDFSSILPEWINIGFSASTGTPLQSHYVHSWSFSSDLKTDSTPSTVPPNLPEVREPIATPTKKPKLFLFIWLPVILLILISSGERFVTGRARAMKPPLSIIINAPAATAATTAAATHKMKIMKHIQ